MSTRPKTNLSLRSRLCALTGMKHAPARMSRIRVKEIGAGPFIGSLPLLSISIGLMLMLTACSNGKVFSAGADAPLDIRVKPVTTIAPPLPAPLHIARVHWRTCDRGSKACLSWVDARRMERNKVAIGRWMGQANAVIEYYRGLDGQSPDLSK